MDKKINELEVMEICVTSRCNLKCRHCYQHMEKNQFVLPYEKIVEIIDYSEQYNCWKYVLSGGEFFTHPQAYEIIKYLINTTKAPIIVVTNSILLDVHKVKDFPKDRVKFKISIDGDMETHDKRRGQGTYTITEGKIKTLRDIGFEVEITMTLVEDNIHCIPTVLSNSTFKNITLMPVATTGAACENYLNQKDSDLYEGVIKHIYKTCREYHDGDHRCCIFPRRFSVKYDGAVYPCSLARDYDISVMGNVNEKTISEVISDYLKSADSDMFFDYDNNSQIGKCNSCKNNNECTRGCRIRAFKWNGSLVSPDPFACKIFNDEYKDKTLGNVYWGTK